MIIDSLCVGAPHAFFFVMKVVLKIIKHCKEEENSLEPVNGQLVGLVQSATNTLEVTNCFPLYVPETETEDTGWLTAVQCRKRTFATLINRCQLVFIRTCFKKCTGQ